MFPPPPYIDRIRRVVPHRLVVTQVIDNFTHFDTSHSLYRFAMNQYPRIGRWSDIIFTNSERNRAEFSTAGIPCYRFAQGVDECFIAPASDRSHASGVRRRGIRQSDSRPLGQRFHRGERRANRRRPDRNVGHPGEGDAGHRAPSSQWAMITSDTCAESDEVPSASPARPYSIGSSRLPRGRSRERPPPEKGRRPGSRA